MSVTFTPVPAPPPGLGPWMRDVMAALTQLDSITNPVNPLVKKAVQASGLGNLTLFPDSTLDPLLGGSTRPYIQVTEDSTVTDTVNGYPSTSQSGGRMLEISGANLPINPAFGTILNYRPSIRLGTLPKYFSNDGLTYYTIVDVSARHVELRGEWVCLGGAVGTVGGYPQTGIISLDAINDLVYMAINSFTASAANVNMRGSDGLISMVTSMRAQKMDIADIDPEMIMGLRAVQFRERRVNEPLIAAGKEPSRLIVGLIAEEVAEGAPELAVLNHMTQDPMSVEYDRVGVAAVAKVQQHDRRIVELEAQVKAQGLQIEQLQHQVSALIKTIGT